METTMYTKINNTGYYINKKRAHIYQRGLHYVHGRFFFVDSLDRPFTHANEMKIVFYASFLLRSLI